MLDLHTSIALRELLTKADVRGKWRTGETYQRHRPMYIYTCLFYTSDAADE